MELLLKSQSIYKYFCFLLFGEVGDVLELGCHEIRVEQTFRLQVEQARLTKLSEKNPIEGVGVDE